MNCDKFQKRLFILKYNKINQVAGGPYNNQTTTVLKKKKLHNTEIKHHLRTMKIYPTRLKGTTEKTESLIGEKN